MEDIYVEVDFEKYCPTCEYGNLNEKFDPCNYCLDAPVNSESEKPVYWKEKK